MASARASGSCTSANRSQMSDEKKLPQFHRVMYPIEVAGSTKNLSRTLIEKSEEYWLTTDLSGTGSIIYPMIQDHLSSDEIDFINHVLIVNGKQYKGDILKGFTGHKFLHKYSIECPPHIIEEIIPYVFDYVDYVVESADLRGLYPDNQFYDPLITRIKECWDRAGDDGHKIIDALVKSENYHIAGTIWKYTLSRNYYGY